MEYPQKSYWATTESILIEGTLVFFGNMTEQDHKQGFKGHGNITAKESIVENISHPTHSLFSFLPSECQSSDQLPQTVFTRRQLDY